jgi:hypothetical protein
MKLFDSFQHISLVTVTFFIELSSSASFFKYSILSDQKNTLNFDIQTSINNLTNQLVEKNMPIFSFKTDLEHFLDVSTSKHDFDSVFKIQSLYYQYLDLLRDYYFKIFCKRIHSNVDSVENIKNNILFEFNIAIDSSTPAREICQNWDREVTYSILIIIQIITSYP